MKYFIALLLSSCFFIQCDPLVQSPKTLPRLLITTDIGGDPDDTQSMIRLLVTANEFKLEGLVASASGTIGEVGKSVVRPDLITELVNAYGEVCNNLQLHDKNYPSEAYLLSIIKSGNPNRQEAYVGAGHMTEGADWIIKKVDESNELLNISIWGGQTDIAQALWKVKADRTASEYHEFISKIRIYDIGDQDKLFDYIKTNHPELFYILSKAPINEDKRNGVYRGMYLDGNTNITSLEWLTENVIENHGPLGALYPKKTWTAPNPHSAMKEGDTPSWFYFLTNGLNVPEHPDYGGWGGRFVTRETDQYSFDAKDSFDGITNGRVTVARWREDFQNDFAARMDRCVKAPGQVNSRPIAVVNGHVSYSPLILTAAQNTSISLDASGSYDPDRESLAFEWTIYKEAGHLSSSINLTQSKATSSLTVPGLDKGEEVHIILKVKDQGTPPLVAYKRIIIRNP